MTDYKKILVVDDEEGVRAVLTVQLKGEGYDVSTAGDGDIAIEMLRNQNFDLILLDLRMPNVNGYEVLSFVKENHPSTKVIILTGLADLRNELDARGLGAEYFVAKPYQFSHLLSAIQNALKEDTAPKSGA